MIFNGSRVETEAFLRSIQDRYYVYVLSRPDGTPFYVGKGTNRRVLDHEAEARRHHPIGESNPFKCNVIRKIIREGGYIRYEIRETFGSDEEVGCLELEARLIREHKRLHEGGTLTNLASGLGNVSGAAPFSLERHANTLSGEPADNPDRAVLNRFLQGIGPVASVPIKPIGQIARILPTTPHPNPRRPTPRCAFALVASAVATGTVLVPDAVLPRSFSYQGVRAVIENWVARDILKAGMAELVPNTFPADEGFRLGRSEIAIIAELIGKQALVERGIL